MGDLHLIGKGRLVEVFAWGDTQVLKLFVAGRDAARDLALARLRERPEGTAICHGDFHPDNVLIDGDAATIIDWTTACSGNPAADFALTSLILQLGAPPPNSSLWTRIAIPVGRTLFYRSYASRYRQMSHLSPKDVQPWMLPIAVARLGYEITSERDQLVTLINQAAKSHKSGF